MLNRHIQNNLKILGIVREYMRALYYWVMSGMY